jgi:hypothetical protein
MISDPQKCGCIYLSPCTFFDYMSGLQLWNGAIKELHAVRLKLCRHQWRAGVMVDNLHRILTLCYELGSREWFIVVWHKRFSVRRLCRCRLVMTDHLRTFKIWIHLLSPFTIPCLSLQLSNGAIIRGLQTSMKGVMVDTLHYHRFWNFATN